MGLALQAMWAANVLDIQRTLHQVCKRLLREPGLPRAEAKQRAAALSELGRIYCAAEAPSSQQEQHVQDALRKLQELYMGAGEDGPTTSEGGSSNSAAPPPPQ